MLVQRVGWLYHCRQITPYYVRWQAHERSKGDLAASGCFCDAIGDLAGRITHIGASLNVDEGTSSSHPLDSYQISPPFGVTSHAIRDLGDCGDGASAAASRQVSQDA